MPHHTQMQIRTFCAFGLSILAAASAFSQQGENCEDPYIIPSLPFTDTGSTVDRANDHDEICPYTYVSVHDVAYTYTPAVDQEISVSLCESSYDTKLYIYANGTPPAIACNDDYCSNSQGEPFRSYLECVPLQAGVPYCIVVDGYMSDAGDYQLTVTACEPCMDTCLGTPENEQPCVAEIDTVNGGCGSNPVVFRPISCGETVCGTAATIDALDQRDTDWYQVTLAGRSILRWDVVAQFGVLVFILAPPCGGTILGWDTSPRCDTASVTSPILEPGNYWLWVGPQAFSGLACSSYVATLTCTAVCDSVDSLVITYAENNLELNWNAPQADDYQIWSSPDAENFPEAPWSLEATVSVASPGPASWTDPDGVADARRYYLVIHVCE